MNDAPRYSAIIFDLDGTLVDSYDALTDAVNFALDAEGLRRVSSEELREYVGEGVERLLQRCMGRPDIPKRMHGNFEDRYAVVCRKKTRFLDGVEPTIRELTSRGYRMAVCTNKPTRFSVDIVEHLGVARCFDAIVGPDLAGARKPDPAHVLAALRPTETPPDEALFVGDMAIDVLGARAAGIDVAVIPTGSTSIEELRDCRPDYILARFTQILDTIRETPLRYPERSS